MLELRDVWKGVKVRGKREWQLAGASVVLPPRRRVALLGMNAVNNASVLSILSGIQPPDKGSVRRVGLACWPFGSKDFLDNASTFRQNASFLGRIYGVDATDIAKIAIDLSGIKLRKGLALRRYPVAERRQLALGLTLALQFDWYFINEQLPRVPAARVATIDGVIADRISRGGVVWATTDPEKVAGYCDAGLVLDHGGLTFYDTITEASEVYRSLVETRAGKRT
ncbi:ATP-binding protein [Hansschlegelia plantiphila]|uniref:ATP-binding protein n=2 Tax=Hansschlegelia plantiphila TaxID=374655 RepID=A0A9W6IZD7_9HYPH|nr:ATP-binding protein [Hansschlegelia plantiphila]